MENIKNRVITNLQGSDNVQSQEKALSPKSINADSNSLQNPSKRNGLKKTISFKETRLTKTRHLSHEDEDHNISRVYKKPCIGNRPLVFEKKPGKNEAVHREAKAEDNETVLESKLEDITVSLSNQHLDIVKDIDTADKDVIWMCSEYIEDIMQHLFTLEKRYPIRADFLSSSGVNSRMRSVLMDWLVLVHHQFNFAMETLYLCNKIMDRFLSVDTHITKQSFQLVGVTAMWLACKYEEVYVPPVREFVKLSDNAFTAKQLREMEVKILTKLKFDLACPSPSVFLRRFSKAASADIKLHSLAKYIMELSIIDFTVVDLVPSVLAAASLALAIMILRRVSFIVGWNVTLQHYSSYNTETLRPIVLKMASVLARAHDDSQAKLRAVRDKYGSGKRLCRISRLPELNLENWRDRVSIELGRGVLSWGNLSRINESGTN